jgi:glycosyltransferase involved in cell wall biosynthesis
MEKTLEQGRTLSSYVFSQAGKITFRIPPNVVPPFVIEAYNQTLSGRLESARALLTEAALAEVDRQVEQGRPEGLLASLLVAVVQQRHGQFDLAFARYEALVRHEPHPLVLNELAEIQRSRGCPSQALAYRQQALQLDPGDLSLAAACAVDHIMLRQYKQGVRLLEQMWDSGTLNESGLMAYLWYLHYYPGADRQRLFDAHRLWGQRFAPPALARPDHTNDRDPKRRLRIGYLTADLCSHSVAYAFDALLQGHDRKAVEVIGYGNVHTPDRMTDYLIPKFDTYRSVYGMEDAAAADLIREDRIDILVAVAGHSSNHRLKVMAYKPAPIQVDLGGINTTGMTQVDYRFTDHRLDPPGAGTWCVEQSVYLPGGALRYATPQNAVDVGTLPALRNGYVTFCSFNNHLKINDQVIALWAQVLRTCPESRLILKFKAAADEVLRTQFRNQFAARGIDEQRLTFLGWLPHNEHWQWYNQADIALDTYPFNGCITTLEALWMGVPTISLAGPLWVSRQGLSVLTGVGLESFVAETPEAFVGKALALADNLKALGILRSTMRQRLRESPLCDCRGFARDLENAFRDAWRHWCQNQ